MRILAFADLPVVLLYCLCLFGVAVLLECIVMKILLFNFICNVPSLTNF